MKHTRCSLPLAGFLVTVTFSAHAQTTTTIVQSNSHERPFAVVENSSMRFAQGAWKASTPLYRYVHDHPDGDYVVFAQNGSVYRLDGADRMAEVKQLYAPLVELSIKQEALAQAQQKLAVQQQRLAKSQQSLARGQEHIARQQASSSPDSQGQMGQGQGVIGQTQGDLGSAQGALGQEQGELGTAQGELGHQQGQIVRDASKRLQEIFDRCVADGSCRRATS